MHRHHLLPHVWVLLCVDWLLRNQGWSTMAQGRHFGPRSHLYNLHSPPVHHRLYTNGWYNPCQEHSSNKWTIPLVHFSVRLHPLDTHNFFLWGKGGPIYETLLLGQDYKNDQRHQGFQRSHFDAKDQEIHDDENLKGDWYRSLLWRRPLQGSDQHLIFALCKLLFQNDPPGYNHLQREFLHRLNLARVLRHWRPLVAI